MIASIIKLMDKVTDAESFRIITLIMLLAIASMFFAGFNYLDNRIESNHVKINHRIESVENSVIPRQEFNQMERRLDQYFEQLDKRLDRIEAKL